MVETKPRQIAVPLSKEEVEKLDVYLKRGGIKKGAFVRKAILAYLNIQEQEAGRE
jgi:predicted DNA-binding protein